MARNSSNPSKAQGPNITKPPHDLPNSSKQPVPDTKPINTSLNSSKEVHFEKPISAFINSTDDQVFVRKALNDTLAAPSSNNNTNANTKPDGDPPTGPSPSSPLPKQPQPTSPPPSKSKPPLPSPPPPSPPPPSANNAPPPTEEQSPPPPPPPPPHVDSTPSNPPSPPSKQIQISTDNSPSTPSPSQDNSQYEQSLDSTPTQTSPSRPAPKSNSTFHAPPGNDNLPPLPRQPKSEISPSSSRSVAKASEKSSKDAITITTGVGAGIGVFVGAVTLGLILMIVWFVRKSKRNKSGLNGGRVIPSPYSPNPHSDSSSPAPILSPNLIGGGPRGNFFYSPEAHGVGGNKLSFTYEELTEATNGFSANNILGEGGFGCVYKGFLPDGREIAVKRLKRDGGQGEREFRAEVAIISRVHHRHLVSLVGYCISENQRLLVFDYVPNNTLHHHLHGEGRPVMEWATRVKVAASAARGIAYLHEDCHPRIIHRDIKSSNILLDNDFVAQVSDFGLAKLALDSNSHVSTRVMGTFGYMAPEYASSGKLTEKSDVYSFGVVLLELITGCKPVDKSRPMGEESLVEWARPLLLQALDKGELGPLVDQRLENNYVESEMVKLIEAAAACVRHLASKRPRMSQVVRTLDNIIEFPDLTNGMKPGQSEVLNPREKSAELRMFQRMAFDCQDNSTGFYERSHSGSGEFKSANR